MQLQMILIPGDSRVIPNSLSCPLRTCLTTPIAVIFLLKYAPTLPSTQEWTICRQLCLLWVFQDPADHNKLVIDPEAAEVIKQIFYWKIQGLSTERIADKLNDLGILCPMEYKHSWE